MQLHTMQTLPGGLRACAASVGKPKEIRELCPWICSKCVGCSMCNKISFLPQNKDHFCLFVCSIFN